MRSLLAMPLLFEKQAWGLAFICALLGLSVLAYADTVDDPEVADQLEAQPNTDAQDDNDLPTLDGSITMEERLRIYRDLDEYSRSVDSTHLIIEKQRRSMRERLMQRFAGSDKDNDGSISREEATESLPQIARHFSQVDTNGDGVVTLDELAAVYAKMRERRHPSMANKPDVKADLQDIESVKRKSKDMTAARKKSL
jgi:hypothetical protein